jgi:hypothetical protein
VSLGLALLVAGVLAPVAARLGAGRWVVVSAGAVVVAGLVVDLLPGLDPTVLRRAVARLEVVGAAGDDGTGFVLLLGALVWCGPAADLVVRQVLGATGSPAPEAAAAAGLRAGRWIGRLERWVLVACVAAGQPELAIIPIGGKALFRYAEVVADARAERPRLARSDGDAHTPGRDAVIEYVIVGSLASWAQAILLGLVVAAALSAPTLG